MSTPITVIGNLTHTPELSSTHGGTPVVNLTLADNQRKLNEATGEWIDVGTTYWKVVVFGKQAANVAASLTTGVRAFAVGSPRTHAWTTSDGTERFTLELVADEVGPSLLFARTTISRADAARAAQS